MAVCATLGFVAPVARAELADRPIDLLALAEGEAESAADGSWVDALPFDLLAPPAPGPGDDAPNSFWRRPDWLPDVFGSPAEERRGPVALLAPDQGGLVFHETSALGRALASRGRLRFDAWSDFDDTTRFGGQLVATTWLRAALDTEAYIWDSDDPAAPGERFGGKYYTGDVNLVAQVVSHPRGTMRTGLGAAWVHDDAGETVFGPQATIALDANLLGPATAGFEIDYGAIEGDELFRWRVEGGWVLGSAELRTGYDKLNLGDENRGGWFASLMMRY
ncbi:hypothetical protein [Alienimonas californiensis]|uniref:Uncharacterized protein n=1 Tax=Alienimonas californiensis TaxID=2527989 RepID=A0A517PAM0_9PLAN|nr:hypothetical protein [Alienimonas californiensis]QDT16419.1 hypothetical protein CA12_25210 [Alienimonas californiensis]